MNKPKKKNHWLRLLLWHRYSGLMAAFVVVLLSVTGILLNHTQELSLNTRYASAPWLMKMYGINRPKMGHSYAVEIDSNMRSNPRWIIAFDGYAYLEQQPLNCTVPLVGALYVNDVLFIANKTQLCLFTAKGELIDTLPVRSGQTIKRLGKRDDNRIILDVIADDNRIYGLIVDNDYTALLTGDVLSSSHTNGTVWSQSTRLPETLATSLLNQYKGKGLPWERVVLDLHSGRIIGLAGVYFMDFIAVLLIFLAFSGVLLWAKRTFFKRKS